MILAPKLGGKLALIQFLCAKLEIHLAGWIEDAGMPAQGKVKIHDRAESVCLL
jgi:hypothetical protein